MVNQCYCTKCHPCDPCNDSYESKKKCIYDHCKRACCYGYVSKCSCDDHNYGYQKKKCCTRASNYGYGYNLSYGNDYGHCCETKIHYSRYSGYCKCKFPKYTNYGFCELCKCRAHYGHGKDHKKKCTKCFCKCSCNNSHNKCC